MADINLNFDSARAKRLKPGEFIVFPEAPGLRLEASRHTKRWTYRFRSPIDAALRQVKLGAWPGMPAYKALVAWERRRDERAAGRDPALERREQSRKIRDEARPQSVAKIIKVYLEALGQINPKKKAPRRAEKGLGEVKGMFKFDLGPIEKRNAADITPLDAVRFLKDIRARGAPSTALRLRREFSAAWRTARAHGLLPASAPNPWPDALKGELAQGERERVLTPGEVRAVLRFLPHYTPIIADALELTLRTGLRSGEVVALRSGWFDEIAGVLWAEIPAAQMKQRRAHRVPFVGRAREIVEARLAGDFLFPSPLAGRHINQKALGVAVHIHRQSSKTHPDRERPRCPVDDWAPHDLRRTAATLLGDLRCPFEVVEAILAHRLPGVSKVYQRSENMEAKAEWLGKLNKHIDTILASESLRPLPQRKVAAA